MKRKLFKWRYMLVGILLANITACSNDDLPQVGRQEQDSGSRTSELVTQTIELQSAGTLQAKLVEAMGSDSLAATVQKLVLSGPFTSTDMTYLRDSLINVSVLDMKDVQIKASDEVYRSNSGNESYFQDNQLCYGMFYQMDNLKDVFLPTIAIAMDQYAFYDCDSLRTVSLPDSLKMMGGRAFQSCDSLKSIVIPDGVKVIETETFEYCYALTSVKLPSGLEKIGRWAFNGCAFTSIELPIGLKEIEYRAFSSCNKLKMLDIPETVTKVGENFVSSNNWFAVIWNSNIDVPSCDNGILFVNTDQIGVENVNNWKAIVINGVTDATINVDDGGWREGFSNQKEFTAHKLTYSRHFGNETIPGGSSGWRTIVLPFTPDSIYHETKGQIAPFNSGIEGAKPFWLRELTSEGFVDVTKIEANKPYIIAMPNHHSYLDEYCLSGTITFVGRDAVLTVTPEEMEPSVGPEFELHPTYNYVERSEAIYTLGPRWNYYEEEDMHYSKSFFIKNYDSVDRFNAYVTTLGGGRSSRSLFGLDTRSKATRTSGQPNTTGIPQIGDM